MIRMAIAGMFSTLALACGASQVGSRQVTNPPTSVGATPQEEAQKEAAQERFDRGRVTLKDRAFEQITLAEANIDALKKLSDSDQGAAKERDDELKKRLSDLRDHLRTDLDKLDKATINDWSAIRPLVEADLNAMEGQLRVAENVTSVPAPRPGAASVQPISPQPTTAPQPTTPLPAPPEGP